MERGADENDLWKSIAICLMLTWLNPHVYLDTVVLVGSWRRNLRTLGSLVRVPSVQVSSSFSHWDMARFLSPVFQNPRAWQILDVVIALVMWSIAYGLLFRM